MARLAQEPARRRECGHASCRSRFRAEPDLTKSRGKRRRRSMAAKPNILVILIDDLRFDEFGAGGHPYIKTPHIDRIAHEGALFERAFHTPPICSPTRASILTGQYASRHG